MQKYNGKNMAWDSMKFTVEEGNVQFWVDDNLCNLPYYYEENEFGIIIDVDFDDDEIDMVAEFFGFQPSFFFHSHLLQRITGAIWEFNDL